MYVCVETNGVLELRGACWSGALNASTLKSAEGCLILCDLDRIGLRIINDLMLESLDQVKIKSYNLVMYSIEFRGVCFKNSRLFGIGCGELNYNTALDLKKFVSSYTRTSLLNPSILSAAGVGAAAANIKKYRLEGAGVTDFVRSGYYGGRCELFKPGTYSNLHYYDFPSMYGNIMQDDLPVEISVVATKELSPLGFFEIEFFGGNAINKLPVRRTTGCYVEVKYAAEGSGVYWGEEILSFAAGGGGVKTITGHKVARSDKFLSEISRRLILDRKWGCKFSKVTLNSLQGRMALQTSSAADRLVFSKDISVGDSLTFKYIWYKDVAVVSAKPQKTLEPRFTNIAAAAAISSKARILLLSLLRCLKDNGNEILYIDTDSVFFQGEPPVTDVKFVKVLSLTLRSARDYSVSFGEW